MRAGFGIGCLAATTLLTTAGGAVAIPVAGLTTGGTPIADSGSGLAFHADRAHPVFVADLDADRAEVLIAEILAVGVERRAGRGPSSGVDSDRDRAPDLVVAIDDGGLIQPAVYEANLGENEPSSSTALSSSGDATAPRHRTSKVDVMIDPAAIFFDLDADGTMDRRASLAELVPRVMNRLAASGISDVDPRTPFRFWLGGSALESVREPGAADVGLLLWVSTAQPSPETRSDATSHDPDRLNADALPSGRMSRGSWSTSPTITPLLPPVYGYGVQTLVSVSANPLGPELPSELDSWATGMPDDRYFTRTGCCDVSPYGSESLRW